MSLRHSVTSSLTVAVAALVIALVYVVVVRFRSRLSWREAWTRTGMVPGPLRWWLVALGCLLPALAFAWLSVWWMPITSEDATSPYHPLLGRGLEPEVIAAAAAYGFISAGFGEELIFRGLIAGALGRRLSRWKANLFQALIFIAPHLLVLLVTPRFVLLLPALLGFSLLLGWLRLRSGSMVPPMLVHGGANTFVGLLVATSHTWLSHPG